MVNKIQCLDLSGKFTTVYPIGNADYNLKSILGLKQSRYVPLKVSGSQITKEHGEIVDLSSLEEVYLFYGRNIIFHNHETEINDMMKKIIDSQFQCEKYKGGH